jgi:hypothetical protein
MNKHAQEAKERDAAKKEAQQVLPPAFSPLFYVIVTCYVS